MDRHGFLKALTFQGGTCLRLCYAGQRYSEDLDFAGGDQFDPNDFDALAGVLQAEIGRTYEVETEVTRKLQRHPEGMSVSYWWVKVVTAPEHPDLPKQRVSIQVAGVPAHTREAMRVAVRYPQLPDSFGNITVVAESAEEICADKLKAFVTSSHLRHRDLWDLDFLARRPGFDAAVLPELLRAKISDYDAASAFQEGRARVGQLSQILESDPFAAALSRFLPRETVERTIRNPYWRESCAKTLKSLYATALGDPRT
jgi:predicted nucleotidyltransferase component of viral defense system